jgi:putative transcriptional regulator
VVFVETSLFTRLLPRHLSDDEYGAFQGYLILHSDAGAIIKGSGGIRKVAIARQGRKGGSHGGGSQEDRESGFGAREMTKRDIGKEIIQGLEEIKASKRGDLKLRVTVVDLPRAAEVPAIRKQLGLSQERFAGLMGVSVATLRNWEQGRREPHGAARSLLLIASKEPSAVLRALTSGSRNAMSEGHAAGVAQKRARYRVSSRRA